MHTTPQHYYPKQSTKKTTYTNNTKQTNKQTAQPTKYKYQSSNSHRTNKKKTNTQTS